MHVQRDTVVRLRYVIRDAQGETLDAGDEAMEYLHGGYGEFFEDIERKLEGVSVGYEHEFHLEPEQAFGDYDADLVQVVARTALPEGIEVGMQFEGLPDGASEDGRIYTLTDLTADKAVLDGNHPLAGLALRIWVKVEGVRQATADELEAGHPGAAGMTVLPAREDDTLH